MVNNFLRFLEFKMEKTKKKIVFLGKNYPDLFYTLFIEGKSVDKSDKLNLLVRAGFLVSAGKGKLKSYYKIYLYNKDELVFVTDFKNTGKNQVFSPYDEEVILCSKFYTPKSCKKVLEIGTGCGTYGIFAAKNGCKVVSVDPNPKAVKYAVLNAKLNGVFEMIDYRCGNLFDSLQKFELFDLIIASLPYLPTSKLSRHYKRIYSDSGEKGNVLLSKTIQKAHKFLSPKGVFKAYTMSLGDEKQSWIEKNIQGITNQPWKVRLDYCYKKPWNFREWYYFKFPSLSKDEDYWLRNLSKNGLGFMHYIKITMEPSKVWKIVKRVKEYNRCIPYRK